MTEPPAPQRWVADDQTNRKFAAQVGVSVAMANKIRTGGRRPSTEVLVRIISMYDLDAMTTLRAHARGAAVFAAYMRMHVFDSPWPEDAAIVAAIE
jgi:hypothetical protein